jgi:hypothetical protein
MAGVWRPVKIGAGGYITGISASSDGSTIACRADTFGGYIWESAAGVWRQLITKSSVSTVQNDRYSGISEIAIAPNKPTRIYIRFMGDVWRSDDRGWTWTATGLNWGALYEDSAQTAPRYMGQKMAVDPNNPDVVYVGTPTSGVYYTFNAGATWTQISTGTIPACSSTFGGTNPGHPGICFDPTSGTTGGKTNTIYIPSYGNGVYQSTNAGGSWSSLASAPTQVSHAKVASDGIYYATNVNASSSNTLYKCSGTTFTNISSGAGLSVSAVGTVVCDPSSAARIIAVTDGGGMTLSTDRGATWGSLLAGGTRVSSDIPWLAWTLESYMSLGDVIFDPANPTTLLFAQGLGVWTTTFSGSPSSISWTSRCKGIENLTSNGLTYPPGGKPVVACWDRPTFYISDFETYPSTHGPARDMAIRHAWDIDCATSDPTFIATMNMTGASFATWGGVWKSTDSGQNWTLCSAPPTGGTIPVNVGGVGQQAGGSIAISTALNFIMVPTGAFPWRTTDGGTTWSECVISGVSTTAPTGFGITFTNTSKIAAADRVAANTFYVYNWTTQGVYRSTDSGANWTKMNTGNIDTLAIYDAKLSTVYGQSGHLFLTSGKVGNPGDANPQGGKFRRSTDGGATWADVGGGTFVEPYTHCTGKAAPGQSYPAVYVAGWKDGTWGLYRSNDNCTTWEQIGDFPAGWLDLPETMEASQDVYGTVVIGLAGSGYMYRTEAMQFTKL